MKPISNDFKNALKGIKQIDAVISYADHENTNFIITQNSEYLITQAQDFLVTESADVVIDNGGIQNCSIYWNTDIFKSVCKMLNLETSNQIAKGTELNVRIGLLVGEDYEYVDYGKFYTTEDSAYQLATGTYTTTAYDRMVKFNIKASENPLTFVEGTTYTLKQYLEMICNKCGVQYSFNWTNLPNGSKQVISGDPYVENKEVTYRDILDDIAESLGTNFIINADNKIANKEIEMTSVMTIDDDILKDTNVFIGEKKDPIDGLQIYDGSTMLNYAGNDSSVLKIKSNNIMSAHSQDLMVSVLSLITDFTYYAYQLETFGVFAIEPFDCFTVTYNNTNYLLCSFHNDLQITSGVSEEISYEFTEEDSVAEYKTSSSEDKLKDASIEIDKANGQIVLKADSNGKIVKAELNADADQGTSFNVKADNIKLEGYTTINDGFSINEYGYMTCTGATIRDVNINGGNLDLKTDDSIYNPSIHIENDTDDRYYTNIYAQKMNFKAPNAVCDIELINRGEENEHLAIEMKKTNLADTNYCVLNPYALELGTIVGYLWNDNIYMSGRTGNITCVSLTQTSLEENKKNIKLYKGALDEILKTDIYEYNLKNEKDNNKKHLGFVIGKKRNYSKEIVALDEEGNEIGVDNYSMTSLCLQAIKEQQEQIEKLQKEIKTLKGDDK